MKIKTLLTSTAIGGAMYLLTALSAAACGTETICNNAPPVILWEGSGEVVANLKPNACILQPWIIDLMTRDNGDMWFTYYQRWGRHSPADMPPVMRVPCVTEQWVVPGTILGIEGDCFDPADGLLYHWVFETFPITTSGDYEFVLVSKTLIQG